MTDGWRDDDGAPGARRPYRYRGRRGSRRLPSRPEAVGSLLERLLTRRQLKGPLRIYRIQAAWRDLVGEPAAGRSFPLSLEKERLVVGVADSTWLQELTFLKASILHRVRELVGPDAVSELYLRVQPGASTPKELRPSPAPPEPLDPEEELRRRPLAPAVAEALTRFEEDLERVSNPDLRRSIRRAFIRQLLSQP